MSTDSLSPAPEHLPPVAPESSARPNAARRIFTMMTSGSKITIYLCLFTLASIAGYLIAREYDRSTYQAEFFTQEASTLRSALIAPDPEHLKLLPSPGGPRDVRLGYHDRGRMLSQAEERGMKLVAASVPTESLERHLSYGLYPPYPEKLQAGLELYDRHGEPLETHLFPQHIYTSYEDIPPLARETLLFLESREMREPRAASFNYVLEWDRTMHSVVQAVQKKLNPGLNIHGGSTLATQWEKFSHSPGGQTPDAKEKLRQIYSASTRLYAIDGDDTGKGRERIILYYVNQFPLGARPDMGEVHGLRDGLHAWFGLDPDEVDDALLGARGPQAQARALRHTAALFLVLRRPSDLLGAHVDVLEQMIDTALNAMEAEGIISTELRDGALQERLLPIRTGEVVPLDDLEFVRRKGVASMRSELAQTIGMESQHDMERLDLSARTTLDERAQRGIESLLIERMRDPSYLEEHDYIRESGLRDGDPANVQYSFILMERTEGRNEVRVEVDTLEKPFNFNRGARVDLGSTSKLRTLVTYLELVADLHEQWKGLDRRALADVELMPRDRIAFWVRQELYQHPHMELDKLLQIALDQKYPAYPANFMTGGGLHRFHNFDKDENGWKPDMRLALRKSVNLPFIRLMQDLVWHYRWAEVGPEIISEPDHPMREEYLMRWIAKDSEDYLVRFMSRYEGAKSGDEVLARFIEHHRADLTPSDFVAIYRYVAPEMSLEELKAHVDEELAPARRKILEEIDEDEWQGFYDRSELSKLNLQDRGYISEIHPIELWCVKQMMAQPKASRKTLAKAMQPVIPELYIWLLEKGSKHAQDNKIYTILEEDAFAQIHAQWVRVGYPFDEFVPSLATALGASADRPQALTELMGAIMSDGKQYPVRRIQQIAIGQETPYEIDLAAQPLEAKQVLRPEVARAVRGVMGLVVSSGTALRAKPLLETELFADLIGKTGTGDHTLKHMTANGQSIEGEAVSRAGVFMYGFHERYFGVLTIYVEGEQAQDYTFTSSMAAQLFTEIAPHIQTMVNDQRQAKSLMPEADKLSAPPEAEPMRLRRPLLGYVIPPMLDIALDHEDEEALDPAAQSALADGPLSTCHEEEGCQELSYSMKSSPDARGR